MYLSDHNKMNEMDGARSANGEGRTCIHGFGESSSTETTWKT